MLLNDLLNNKSNKKNTIRHLYRITNQLFKYAYVSSYVGCTLFCLLVLVIVFKKRKPNFYLLGEDFVDESTSKEDMEILFKQLGRLTKVAPVYFVYGNHENKIKFTRNELNQEITKNNITILNDQEVHLNNITLISRKDYTNRNRKKAKDYNLTNKTYNIILDHQPKAQKKISKTISTFNSADILITDKCSHSLIRTIYNPTLRVTTKKKHSKATQRSLIQTLLVGVFQ